MRSLKPALLLALILATPAGAQEPPLPPDAVARVGEEILPRSEFDRWFRTSARSEKIDPPRFARCVKSLRKGTAERKDPPSRRELRRRCVRRAAGLRAEVMQFLLEAAWVRQEAAARGIAVAPRQLARRFEREKRVAFDSEQEYRRFLRRSGFTEAQMVERVLLSMLQERVTRQVTAAARRVSADDVRRYYANHRRQYRGVPREQALRQIRRRLSSERQQRALDRFVGDFRARYRAITVCADAYTVPDCGSTSPPQADVSARSRSRGSPGSPSP